MSLNFVTDRGRNPKTPMNIDPDSASHNGSAISPSNDPMRVARQAIRSQVTAREYIERQLVQAQNAIEELRIKLRHVHHEREVAVSAAQTAIAARDIAERSMRAAESALTSERANRARIDGMLRDAETTIRDLREKLATANQTMQVEKAAERPNRQSTNDGVIVEPTRNAPTVRQSGLPVVKRHVGRPRKVTVAQPAPAMIWPVEEPLAIREAVSANKNEAHVPIIRRPVGRPRRTAEVNPIIDDQEPIQWWVESWKGR